MPAARDPSSDAPKDVQPPRAEDADLTDVAEPVRPVEGVTTRLISDSVWAQVQSVLRSWLGD